jgi:hypothetical protein
MKLTRAALVGFGGLALVFAVLVALSELGVFGSHDDPVVVDNGPIEISKGSAVPREDGGRRWAIHHSARLTLLHAYSRRQGSGQWLALETPRSLRGVKEIVFRLVATPGEAPSRSMVIFRDQFLEEWPWNQQVRLDPEFTFVGDGTYLRPHKDFEGYRIGEIRFGQHVVCLAEADRPLPRECRRWDNPPDEIRILLCAETDKCGRKKP